MTPIETDRLILRPFRRADLPAYAAIRRKPGVTRFLPSHTEDPEESYRRAAATLEAFGAAWRDRGYGPWAVVVKGGGLIGHLGLRHVAEQDATEVLFLLDPAMHGRGLATEGARAALDWGFGTLGLDRIVAWAMPENAASRSVMERLGMRRTPGLVTVFGLQAVEYSAGIDDWQKHVTTGGHR